MLKLRLFASLPMYALPGMAAANAAFWRDLRENLAGRIADLPETLAPPANALPDFIAPETLFSQMCGYPLHYLYKGQYRLLGTPLYDLPGCELGQCGVPLHRSFIVVARGAGFETLEDLRGKILAVNGYESNSGMNLPRRLFAEIAGGKPFFSGVTVTGSHVASMAAVAGGTADAAPIDCVTFGFCTSFHPELTVNLRILAETPASPAIPFITAAATPAAAVVAIIAALHSHEGLKIAAIMPPMPAAYDVIPQLATQARALGYAALA